MRKSQARQPPDGARTSEATEGDAAGVRREAAFGRDQLLAARRFGAREKDILSAVLEPRQRYTIRQAEQAISEFIERRAD